MQSTARNGMVNIGLNNRKPKQKHPERSEMLNDYIKELDRKSDYYQAEYYLLYFTETVCKIHGQYKGIYLIYYRILEWVADKLLWRKGVDEGKPGKE